MVIVELSRGQRWWCYSGNCLRVGRKERNETG